jgi:hypothetical protein
MDFELAADASTSWLRQKGPPPSWKEATIWTGAGAAVLAAAEIYKRVLAKLGAAIRHDSELEAVMDFQLRFPVHGLTPKYLRIGVVSAGAITNCALFLLARTGIALQFDVWDDDILRLDNFNRYPLFETPQLDMFKVEALASIGLAQLTIKPIPRPFGAEEAAEADTFIVGADRIMPRWDVARRRPATAVIGSTDHYLTLTSIHRGGNDGCPACLHPHDDGVNAEVPTVSFVSFAAGLEVALLLAQPPSGNSWYALTRSWLRPDVELCRPQGRVPRNADCPVRCDR